MSMNYAENVQKVYALMSDLNVSLYDLELFGHIQDREDLACPVGEAYNKMLDDHFDLVGDPHVIEGYHQATADYVGEALAKAGLLEDEDD